MPANEWKSECPRGVNRRVNGPNFTSGNGSVAMQSLRGGAALAFVGAACIAMLAAAPIHNQPGAVVCVGADHVLRVDPSGKCPSGASRFNLVVGNGGDAGNGDDKAVMRELKSRVAALEQDVQSMRGDHGRAASRVAAPFEVDDKDGKPILVVGLGARELEIRAPSGRPVLVAGMNNDGGTLLRTQDESGGSQVVLGVSPSKTPQVVVRRDGVRRGILYVNEDGLSQLQLMTKGEIPTVFLTQGQTGNGLLRLSNAGGDMRVEAGTTRNDRGTVQVGPFTACVGSGGLLPPSCLMGNTTGGKGR